MDTMVFKLCAHSCEVCHDNNRLTNETKCQHEVCKHCLGECAVCHDMCCEKCGITLECEPCRIEMWVCKSTCAFREELDGETTIPIGCPDCRFEMTIAEDDEDSLDHEERLEDQQYMREQEEEIDDDFIRQEEAESDDESELAHLVDENEEESDDDEVQIVE
uniref:RING-type domain-containing protein n=2 Tax=Percolomonas cosmopolitus TaxID=63605 RepID=A0A7S1KUL9_9EUKA|mmetsp:Transcript_9669/g.35876  ORF Transcript_9669/g.35876 Transcript_9669/m.35876 type:complete len:162 (+) Transcript_9669:298-783(+)